MFKNGKSMKEQKIRSNLSINDQRLIKFLDQPRLVFKTYDLGPYSLNLLYF